MNNIQEQLRALIRITVREHAEYAHIGYRKDKGWRPGQECGPLRSLSRIAETAEVERSVVTRFIKGGSMDLATIERVAKAIGYELRLELTERPRLRRPTST
ncbi:MAG TPA: hypothetical protein VEL07_09285 [Planctomycetota bacterium]|nr:hypothetical protein [Planctomycetota bacterium]